MKKNSIELAETIMKRNPDPITLPYKTWSYAHGFVLWGFIRLFESTKCEKYKQYVLDFCNAKVGKNGELESFTAYGLDDIMAGSLLIWAYNQTHEERFKTACTTIRLAYNDYPKNADGGFWHAKKLEGQMWVDGLFMGCMFLVRYGAFIGDKDYCFNECIAQIEIAFNRCEKDNTGLLYHAYSEKPTEWSSVLTGQSPEVWCEGLGWYAMILVEILENIPQNYPNRNSVEEKLLKLLNSLKKVQDAKTGLWFQVVDKVKLEDNWNDSSGSAMFLYTFIKAKNLGITNDVYDDLIKKAYTGLTTKLITDENGNTNVHDACNGLCVQISYEKYVNFKRVVNAKEAVAAALWATQAFEYNFT